MGCDGALVPRGTGQVIGQPFVSTKRFGPYLLVGSGKPLRTDGVCMCVVCERERERENLILFLKDHSSFSCDVED